jgi:hypothetical protein
MVETVEKIGDVFGVVWALFEHESGQLTLLAMSCLALLALATAYRCARATLPAMDGNHTMVIAVGSAITAVFAGVGLFFVVQIIASLVG